MGTLKGGPEKGSSVGTMGGVALVVDLVYYNEPSVVAARSL
jgi:hypothetical protein